MQEIQSWWIMFRDCYLCQTLSSWTRLILILREEDFINSVRDENTKGQTEPDFETSSLILGPT